MLEHIKPCGGRATTFRRSYWFLLLSANCSGHRITETGQSGLKKYHLSLFTDVYPVGEMSLCPGSESCVDGGNLAVMLAFSFPFLSRIIQEVFLLFAVCLIHSLKYRHCVRPLASLSSLASPCASLHVVNIPKLYVC